MRIKVCIFVVLSLLIPSRGSAQSTTYSSEAAFDFASTGLTTISFDVLAPQPGTYSSYATPPGVTLSGVNFSSTGSLIAAVSDTFCCTTYARGSDTLDSGPANNIVATLPANTTAIGFDLYTVTLGDPDGAAGNADIVVNGTTYIVGTDPAPSLVFFGITSSSPISSLAISAEQVGAGTAVDLTDFSFGNAKPATSVPEGGSVWLYLLVTGAISLGAILFAPRRRWASRL
ncbi:MAG: hypothetical protein ABR987_13875 [Terracidiphilus sp.]